jgi:hypothetical protein
VTVLAGSQPGFKWIIDDATDNLGLGKPAKRNRVFRTAMHNACGYWRARHYSKRFNPHIVYAAPYHYQWGMRDRKQRVIPISKRTPFFFKGDHRNLFATGSIRATAKTGKIEGKIALPFGHPIPNKVRNSNALRELSRTATYIAPMELQGILRVFTDSIVNETRKNWAVNKGALRKAERAEKRFEKEFTRNEIRQAKARARSEKIRAREKERGEKTLARMVARAEKYQATLDSKSMRAKTMRANKLDGKINRLFERSALKDQRDAERAAKAALRASRPQARKRKLVQ